MKRLPPLALAALLAAALLFGVGGAGGEPTPENRLFELVNSERAAKGLPPLEHDGGLVTIAMRHSRQMAESGRLEHNPNLRREVTGWKAIGENVGKGVDADQVHRAFMNSETHRAQILDEDYRGMAVGFATSAEYIWVTEIFILRAPIATPMTKPTTKPQAPRGRRTTSTKAALPAEPPKSLVRREVRVVSTPMRLEVVALRPNSPERKPSPLPLAVGTTLVAAYFLALVGVTRRLGSPRSAQRISPDNFFERGWIIGHYPVHAQIQ